MTSPSVFQVVRVPQYSPYAVAEYALALLMTLNRKVHRAYNRVREGNFSISGLMGFDLRGKTIGVIGTGKIGRTFIGLLRDEPRTTRHQAANPSPARLETAIYRMPTRGANIV